MDEKISLGLLYLEDALMRTNNGYAECVPDVAYYMASFLREGKELPPEAKNFLLEALKKISEGEDANVAFKLNGRKNLETLQKDTEFCLAVERAIKAGVGVDEAFDVLAEHGLRISSTLTLRASKEAIRTAYYKLRNSSLREEINP